MRRALIIAALLLPAVAHADPISVFAAVLATTGSAAFAGGVAAVTSFLAANAFAVGLVAVNVFGAASGRRKARKAAALQRAEYNASLQDRSVTTLSANPPWRIVYGRCITGGDIVAIFTSDKTGTRPNGASYTKPDALKHLVIVLAAHQVQAINEVFIDGVALGALDGSGWVTTGEFYKAGEATFRTVSIAPGGNYNAGTVVTVLDAWYTVGAGLEATTYPVTVTLTSGNTVINNGSAQTVEVRYTINATAARVRVSKQLGTDTQTVDTYLNSVAPTQWDSSCRLRGLAYVVLTLDLEEPRFQGGPPNVTFDVSGRLALDPRTATTAWTQNPAVLVRDFLTSPWGYACASTDIDTTLHNAAANACDVAISLDVGGVVTTGQPTYTCNGAFTTADSREAVLEDLCESMAGFASYGATWGIVAGAWTAPVMTLTDDDLDGQLEVVQAGAGMEALFNGLRGQYIAAGKATPSDFDSYANATFVAADGQALWSDIALPFTNNKARARNLARVFVERNRDGLVIRYPAKLRAWPLQIGDRVTVTSAEYGFSAKPFRVTDWQFGATTAVQLTLQEDAAAVYDLADAATADPAPNTALPNPWLLSALTGVTATSGASTVLKSGNRALIPRILVQWNPVTDAYVADGTGRIELLWMRNSGPWQRMSLPGDSTSAYITGVDNRDFVVIEARARNGLGAVSNSVFVGHVVLASALEPEGNLIDPSWWRPGATMEWPEYVGASAANAIVWGTGPKLLQQALWRATAVLAGGVNGGWEQGSLAGLYKNAFAVDVKQTYRFALPVFLTAGHSGQWEFGPSFGGVVCTLNTATPVADPRFYLAAVTTPQKGRWCLLVGYVFPAGSTGLSNAGAGVYDMETGELYAGGTNFCWASAATECAMRVFFTAGGLGSVNYWGFPLVERIDFAQPARITYIGGLAVGTNQLANSSVTEGSLYDVSTATGSTGSPGASVRVVTMWGPTITTEAGDELDFVVSGVLDETFWSQCTVAHVELWLTHAPTFGGTQTEFGTRRRYMAPVDVYTSTTPIVLDMTGQLGPGAVTQDYVLRVSITYRDAAGAAKQCGKNFSADAQWRVVRRKR
jgi:hypothetical protein